MSGIPRATIRRATADDLPALHSLLQRYYAEGDVHHPDDESSLQATLHQHPYGFFLAEFSPQEIAGCVLFRALSIPGAAECKRLFVLPQHRGHHLAALLMDTLEDTARASNLRYLYLDSKDNFAAAIAMYRRRGYTDIPRYNQNPEATIFLRKDLAPPK
jgi:ribosomal protein S18 acetylase RimI-like enzyme